MKHIKDLVEANSYFSLDSINDNKISFKTKFFALSDLDHAYDIKILVKTKYPELKVKIHNDFERILITINYEKI